MPYFFDERDTLRFYLGTHMPSWLALTETPLFVSRRRLAGRKTFPRAAGRWVLDSGGYSELHLYGEWRTTVEEYAGEVLRYQEEIGGLDWAAPMDWMCEPSVLKKTGLTVEQHQRRTLVNYHALHHRLGDLVAPVLQGWVADDYHRHVEMYERSHVPLYRLPIVGVGSVCRRDQDQDIQRVLRSLKESTPTIKLHAFGVRGTALRSLDDVLTSADSMAWSSRGRHDRIPGHTHKSCANCLTYAERWYEKTMSRLGQQRLEITA